MEESSSLQLDGETIRYRSTTGDWDLPLAEIRIIGESTDPMGPSIDDYFLCFATGPESWFEASFYATGRDAFLQALESKLGAPLNLNLCNSTDFASRILWPPPLVSEFLFHYEEVPSKGWLSWLLGSKQVRQTNSEPVRKYLNGERR